MSVLFYFLLRDLETLLLDFIFNNMSRMHLSDAEAGVKPLFEKKMSRNAHRLQFNNPT